VAVVVVVVVVVIVVVRRIEWLGIIPSRYTFMFMASRVQIEDFRRLHLILDTMFLHTVYADLCKRHVVFVE
jgi:hypothetical protein